MASIESVTLDAADPTAANRFYTAAHRAQPATVNGFIGALDAGATPLKPAAKSFRATAASHKPGRDDQAGLDLGEEDAGPATRQIDEIVLLPGVADVAASKRFSVDRGLAVAKSFGRKHVESANSVESAELALYGRCDLAGVSPDGTGSHRLMMGSDAGPSTDQDRFACAAAPALAGRSSARYGELTQAGRSRL
jgi:hypothetical protein